MPSYEQVLVFHPCPVDVHLLQQLRLQGLELVLVVLGDAVSVAVAVRVLDLQTLAPGVGQTLNPDLKITSE